MSEGTTRHCYQFLASSIRSMVPSTLAGQLVAVGLVVGRGRQSGGVTLLDHRLEAGTPCGVRFCWVWLPVVSLVDSLNHRLGAVIPAG